jgi:hypothetical protein
VLNAGCFDAAFALMPTSHILLGLAAQGLKLPYGLTTFAPNDGADAMGAAASLAMPQQWLLKRSVRLARWVVAQDADSPGGWPQPQSQPQSQPQTQAQTQAPAPPSVGPRVLHLPRAAGTELPHLLSTYAQLARQLAGEGLRRRVL